MLFDDEPERQGVWTHFSAYERLDERFELVAVCDPEPERRERAAARRPSVRAFASLPELLDAEPLDVVSLCTPIELHAAQLEECAGRARAVVCEKPLSADLDSGMRALAACEAGGTIVAVNYYKRFEGAVQAAAGLLADGAIGELRTALALYTGPLDAVGSHAVDLLHFLAGELTVVHADGAGALATTAEGATAVLAAAGPRHDLVFEVDVIGSEGRLRILDNCERLELFRFAPSARYGGYRELEERPAPAGPPAERFLPLFLEVADTLDGTPTRLTSDGASALATQATLDRIGDGG